MPEVPLYERPGRELGSVWTQTPRACENCEQTHQALDPTEPNVQLDGGAS